MQSSSIAPIAPLVSPSSDSCSPTTSGRPQKSKRLSSSIVPSPQRVRKRIPWRGKTCIISLPTPPDTELQPLCYLTRREVDERLHKWQTLGYSTGESELEAISNHTFNKSDLQTQTRPPFPDFADILAEREKRPYRAKIPDRAQWDSHVNSIREARLRALGVTLADDVYEVRESPAIVPHNHYTSSRASLLSTSPSTAPRIAPTPADLPYKQLYDIPMWVQDTRCTSPCTSSVVASDMQPSSDPIASHLPRYSIAQSQSSADLASPYHASEHRRRASQGSRSTPPTYETEFRRTGALSEQTMHSTSGSRISTRAFSTEDIIACIEQKKLDAKYQNLTEGRESGNIVSSPKTSVNQHQEQSDHTRDSELNKIAPELRYPIPRSHHEGISQMLEGGLHKAKYKNPGFRIQSHKAKPLTRSYDTSSNSKITYTQSPTSISNPRDATRPLKPEKHAEHQSPSELGMSALNALAPEFKSSTAGLSPCSPMAGATMRPTAPTFTPIATSQKAALPGEFSFLSIGPSFNPSVISKEADLPSGQHAAEQINRIFSTVSYPSSSKAVQKSRAIPILRPSNELRTSGSENEVQEDESGRITQAEGRQKRLRRSNRGTEQVAQYALPSEAPSLIREQHSDTKYHQISPSIRHDHIRQESSSLEKTTQAANQLKEIIDDLSASEDSNPPKPPTQDADSDGQVSAVHCLTTRPIFDDARLRPTSPSILSSQEVDSHDLPTGIVGPLNEHLIAHGSGHTQVLKPSADSSPEVATRAHNPQPLADLDALGSVYRRDSPKPSSTPTTPAPDAKTGFPKSQNLVALQADGNNEQDSTKAIANGISYIDPSYEEIDAVLRQLDNESSRVGMKDNGQPHLDQNAENLITLDFNDGHRETKTAVLSHLQDNARGARSTGSLSPPYQHLPRAESESADSSIKKMIAENARFSPSHRPPYVFSSDQRSLQGTDIVKSTVTSEGNNTSSSSEGARVNGRQSFPDAPINRVIGNTLQARLAPLERALAEIQCSLVNLTKRPTIRSNPLRKMDEKDVSDADDEDDVQSENSRTKSPKRYTNMDKLKTLATQVKAAQQSHIPAYELASVTDDIKELKAVLQETRPSFTDVKTAVEEAVAKQMRGRSGPITSSHQSAAAEKNQLHVTGLESMLKIAEGRAEDELKARRATEDALADAQRLLRLSLQDAAEQRESAEETERSLSAFHEERHEVLRRNAMLEGTQESLQKAAADLAEKNAALEGTLEEYRLSSAQWRNDIDTVRNENSDLRRTLNALKAELEDGIGGRHAIGTRFDRLQDEMTIASQNIAQEQSLWRRKEEEYKTRYEVIAANYEYESTRCKKMETEIAAQCQTSRLDNEEHQRFITECKHEIHHQREATRLEQDRMREIIDHDREAAMLQLNELCTNLGKVTANFEAQLDQANQAARTERARYEKLLQEAAASTASALREHQDFHDRVVKEQHEQVSQITVRERKLIETENSDRLALAGEKMFHYQDKMKHLEEQLEIAKSAARVAVQAVQSEQPTSARSYQPRVPMSDTVPEKISPQALRESILVLQEQLQDRETKIEELEQKLFTVDVDAPNKLKVQETEIAWLRELFDVRLGDLQDLIVALAQPTYDREAIKGAAIRLKSNLEMEQQEKARAQAGEQLTNPFTGIVSLTASPRSLPLAAAAAWGNWRKGRNASGRGDAGMTINNTLSRSSASTQSLLSGLLTPPHGNTRQGARSRADIGEAATTSSRRRPRSDIPIDTHLVGDGEPYEHSLPVTPSLMQTINYDADAISADRAQIQDAVGRSGDNDEDEDEDVDKELFGRPIATFPDH
ncbi:MAG: hypothetical protein Q9216_000667 [Gyalolechia sp. 2 TL-2023]